MLLFRATTMLPHRVALSTQVHCLGQVNNLQLVARDGDLAVLGDEFVRSVVGDGQHLERRDALAGPPVALHLGTELLRVPADV
eukprot:1095325-Prymnesium_polylepis.2